MRNAKISLLVATVLAFAWPAFAQQKGHGPDHQKPPYAEMVARPIKALSSDQIADLKAGRGMGLSLPAELNGYPGPKHVSELSDQLGLSAQQRQTTAILIEAMSKEAIASGAELIALETKLETLFADRTASKARVRVVIDRIGAVQANLRYVHLKSHLAMHAAMTPEQTRRYAVLRGYGPAK